mmetsp:Transcript_15683/g.15816  ORF Transcript_15683/g.15816 Transcript_15683/m.15816 type:complete len:358 (+) Transcript_15683:959-2032(+)
MILPTSTGSLCSSPSSTWCVSTLSSISILFATICSSLSLIIGISPVSLASPSFSVHFVPSALLPSSINDSSVHSTLDPMVSVTLPSTCLFSSRFNDCMSPVSLDSFSLSRSSCSTACAAAAKASCVPGSCPSSCQYFLANRSTPNPIIRRSASAARLASSARCFSSSSVNRNMLTRLPPSVRFVRCSSCHFRKFAISSLFFFFSFSLHSSRATFSASGPPEMYAAAVIFSRASIGRSRYEIFGIATIVLLRNPEVCVIGFPLILKAVSVLILENTSIIPSPARLLFVMSTLIIELHIAKWSIESAVARAFLARLSVCSSGQHDRLSICVMRLFERSRIDSCFNESSPSIFSIRFFPR